MRRERGVVSQRPAPPTRDCSVCSLTHTRLPARPHARTPACPRALALSRSHSPVGVVAEVDGRGPRRARGHELHVQLAVLAERVLGRDVDRAREALLAVVAAQRKSYARAAAAREERRRPHALIEAEHAAVQRVGPVVVHRREVAAARAEAPAGNAVGHAADRRAEVGAVRAQLLERVLVAQRHLLGRAAAARRHLDREQRRAVGGQHDLDARRVAQRDLVHGRAVGHQAPGRGRGLHRRASRGGEGARGTG